MPCAVTALALLRLARSSSGDREIEREPPSIVEMKRLFLEIPRCFSLFSIIVIDCFVFAVFFLIFIFGFFRLL